MVPMDEKKGPIGQSDYCLKELTSIKCHLNVCCDSISEACPIKCKEKQKCCDQ